MAIAGNRTNAAGSAAFNALIPLYWDQVLGTNLYPSLHFYNFGTKRKVPSNFGLSIKIPRTTKRNIISQIVSASEGAAVGTSPLSSQFVSGTLKQFGGAYRHSDVVIMTALSDVIELSLRDIARDIAKRMDTHVRDQLSNVGQGFFASAGAPGGLTTTSGSVKTTGVLKSANLLKAAVTLERNDNPRPPDGHYPALIHPDQVFDLQSSLTGNSWLEINKFGSNEQVQHIYRGEIGRIFGTRPCTTTNLKRLMGAGGMSADTSGYRAYVFAPDSFYVTEISDMTAKTFVKQLGSGGTSDPINQVATVGAKVFFTAIPANWGGETRIVRLVNGSKIL